MSPRRGRIAAAFALAALVACGMRAHAAEPTPAALARLQRALGELPRDHAVAVRYEGALVFEGHYATPHAHREYRSSRRIVVAAGLARQDWTTWRDDDTTRSVETTLLLGERVLRREDAGEPFVELAGREADEAALAIWEVAPPLAGARALAARGHGLTGGPVSSYQSTYSWPERLGTTSIVLDVVDLPFAVIVDRDEPRLGTLSQQTHYFGASQLAGSAWPDSLMAIGYPPGLVWHSTEKRTAFEDHVALAELAAPDSVRPAAAPGDTTPVVRALAPHVWAVDLPDADTRSLVVEFTDHLVVLETSADVPHGERLHRALRGQLPAKPIRWVSFGHHHPDYTGGLRTFIADSATVVCAGANVDYVNEIGHMVFNRVRDRLAVQAPGGMTPRCDTLRAGRWRHADAMNEIVAIDIGARSHHTDHYLVFWLPRAGLLFEGDLGWFTTNGAVRASSRAEGLLQSLDEAHVAPATLVQGWPVTGNAQSLSTAQLRALVAARRP